MTDIWYNTRQYFELGKIMAILDVVEFPHPTLLKVTKPVDKVDDSVRKLVDDMFETMYHDHGCGLAANQVAVDKSIFVMDMSQNRSAPLVFINPEIIEATGELVETEGCLSFPGIYLKIARPAAIKVKCLDYDGNSIVREFEGYPARCVHHENDHLLGKTFFDYLKPMQRKLAEKKLAKNKKRRL